ncbi:2-oxoglutarate dehydrogenase E1 component [Pseudoroseomonas wenyumeiae]|uniref:2-oxoglutarate dehydrogenase E1 component n=1 Tax=Teichococcus wenyumeiae TaxID=2478470 RepID=A0A3A9J595_9PROT|nr:2-oxoglutarate dehydrogenase E1 component [Pseudoroseomonas wenyumeiae]RKK02377.1 2-oxoglutarate dehydrogenase E1 component [Pseudoroseomonas wenyumeiae]RMI26420.1 2-oxoglutarate dehydrogenase E1 component [Pseudoroseomonas wenyumeiae]
MAGIDILASAMTGANAAFLADLYARWVDQPDSVDPSFQELFAALNDDARAVVQNATGASWAPRPRGGFAPEPEAPKADPKKGGKPAAAPAADPAAARQQVLDSIRALMLIRAYRVRGHLEAQLDPLHLTQPKAHPELDPKTYGFTDADLDRPIFIDRVLGKEQATLREIITICRASYCGSIGVEFMHIQDPEQKSWIQQKIEGAPWAQAFDAAGKRKILQQLTEAEGFEAFCARKYVGTKRFGLEGGEVTIPAVQTVIETAADAGVNEIVIGMAHRGRLNTLVNVVKKPFTRVFAEFKGVSANPDDVQGSGDVKYHLGTSTDLEINGRQVHLSLQPNPSHLEVVDPVVVGKVRARQDMAGDTKGRRSVMGILLHGDAAFAGQGVVYETLAMSQLIGYRTGGTVHVVTNNQIGFTTVPAHAYSGLYCTDVAKSVQAPILHVNGDDPEAVVFCARMAAEYRMKFGADIVLDVVCYRRHGHNETDEPAFTQPIMYARIKETKTTRTLYAERLAQSGAVPAADSKSMLEAFNAQLEDAYQAAQTFKPNKADWLEGHWSGLKAAGSSEEEKEDGTAVALDTLREVGAALSRVPEGFNANSKIVRQLEAKKNAIESGEGIDWATGEALAFGSLLVEGHRIRLSGEDVQRGTFSHRHAVLVDQQSQAEYMPLNNIRDGQARMEAFNSLLSEMGVLGFDYGYTLADPNTLTLWEGQFGDFANGAQVVIDQFIASAETKWLRMSGLVMLLPHGYEGQGPEHSSARLERYLQLCAENNMAVCNFTTPANYFHALRRQLKRNYRKPLIVMTPKSLLRHKLAVSSLADFAPGSTFQTVIPEVDAIAAPDQVKRVVICTGKVYYDLLQERRDKKLNEVAIIRLEQMYPFPKNTLARVLGEYKNAEIIWCQEEPENMGAWTFVDRRIEKVLKDLGVKSKRPVYVGREEAASPATGSAKVHQQQQEALVREALGLS